jgi:CRP-like cAMP-binding protein
MGAKQKAEFEEKVEILKRFYIFEHLTQRNLEKLSFCLEPLTLKNNNYLFKQGDSVDGIYLIVSGEFRMLRTLDCPQKSMNKTLPHSCIGKNEIIGLQDIVKDFPFREFSVQ